MGLLGGAVTLQRQFYSMACLYLLLPRYSAILAAAVGNSRGTAHSKFVWSSLVNISIFVLKQTTGQYAIV